MQAKPPLLSVAEAIQFLASAALPLSDTETVPTLAANGRVLAAAQVSQIDVPNVDNAQMDGYAVRAAECVSGAARLRISQRIPAGHVGVALETGTVARIFTGATVPEGADAVVMQEVCEVDGDHVIVRHRPEAGEWIRTAGEDIKAASTILPAGVRLRAQELGLAASVGLAVLPVVRKLRVAVFFTGDELTTPGAVLESGAVYNTNRFLLHGLLENLGCEVTDFGIVPDQLQATRDTLRAAAGCDLILTSGGVSVGEEDHVKPAVAAEGRLTMWQIAMKPGKPLAFGEIRRPTGTGAGKAFFIGLPGNPVSAFVTFLVFVRPFLLRLQGVRHTAPRVLTLRADFNWPKADRRQEFLRARFNDQGGLDLFPHQGSGVLSSTVWGDGLIDNPPNQRISAGDLVRFLPFDHLLN